MLMTIFRAPICTFPCLSISKHSRLIKLLVSLGKHSRRIRGTPFPLMARSPNLVEELADAYGTQWITTLMFVSHSIFADTPD